MFSFKWPTRFIYNLFSVPLLFVFHDNLFREMKNKNSPNVCLMCFNRENYPLVSLYHFSPAKRFDAQSNIN